MLFKVILRKLEKGGSIGQKKIIGRKSRIAIDRIAMDIGWAKDSEKRKIYQDSWKALVHGSFDFEPSRMIYIEVQYS